MTTNPSPLVIDYVVGKPRDSQTFREVFLETHRVAVDQGPRGPFLLFMVSITSTAVLIGRGCAWVVRKCRGQI